MTSDKPIIFFDGVCGLCNWFVDRVISIDRSGIFMFAPLQGSTAAVRLPESDRRALDSVVVVSSEGGVLRKSRAVLYVVGKLPGLVKALQIFRIIPSSILDIFYNLVAKHRFKVFGKRSVCRIPTESEKSRFLP